MSDPQIFLGSSFRVEVSRDKLTATMQAEPGTVISSPEVLAKLKEIGISGVDDGVVIEGVQNRKSGPLALAVARGKPPADERPGKVELRMPVASQENGLVVRVIPGNGSPQSARLSPEPMAAMSLARRCPTKNRHLSRSEPVSHW
jgi:hypothetical protein